MKIPNEVIIQLFQYPLSIYVTFVNDLKDCSGLTGYRDNNQDIEMLIDVSDKTENVRSMIVHEIIHVKQLTEKFIETKFDNETEAYFIQRLYELISDAYSEYMLRLKKERKNDNH